MPFSFSTSRFHPFTSCYLWFVSWRETCIVHPKALSNHGKWYTKNLQWKLQLLINSWASSYLLQFSRYYSNIKWMRMFLCNFVGEANEATAWGPQEREGDGREDRSQSVRPELPRRPYTLSIWYPQRQRLLLRSSREGCRARIHALALGRGRQVHRQISSRQDSPWW